MADDEGTSSGEGQGQGEGQGEGAVTRTEFNGLVGKVDQLLEALKPGKGEGDGQGDAPAGKSIAEQVRAGIDELERKRAADQSAADAKAREDATEARLKALEEQPPGPPETWLSRLQRTIYGQEPDGSPASRGAR